ncbi:hypothetical protein DICVIV_00120 [Dictyocaulus viviparus]|uniref:BZIP domain-containing protein n=1 Tax=Dictyocaulus viviparus TaxID=29172 RepID=A0A0D8YG91_DICVI|nr:hypothetical protein DICVIV_00120 [Dictyocaulus viviparus]
MDENVCVRKNDELNLPIATPLAPSIPSHFIEYLLSDASETSADRFLAYHVPTVPQQMTSNSLLNPYWFSILPSFTDPTTFTFPDATSLTSACSKTTTLSNSSAELESVAESSSQSHDSSQITGLSPRNICPERASSAESCSLMARLRRGRPQQEISDDDDPSSQKRRHRRLYARQYRAQMRHKVDEVKVLKTKLEEMRRIIENLESSLANERREHQHKTILLNSMIQSKLIP